MRSFTLLPIAVASIVNAEPADVSKALAGILEGSDVPALAAAVVLRGDIVATGASGIRKLGEKNPVTVDDKFHIGSNTKSMTATLAAILVRDDKIDWQTTVTDAFPRLKIHPGYAKATLEQLLANTGGCPGDFEPDDWSKIWQLDGRLPTQRLALAKMILTKPPAYPPGEKYEYSNAGFSIAGAMLEVATRKSYEDLLATHVFKPLGMRSAGFRAPATKGKIDQPYGHHKTKLTRRLKAVDPEPGGDNPNAIAPAGLVHCNIADHAKYARAHLGFGPDDFLSKDERHFLHRPRNEKEGYALGWAVLTDQPWAKGPALNHTGSNTMWFSVIWLAPKRDFAVVAACNSGAQEGFEKCNEAVLHLIEKFLP